MRRILEKMKSGNSRNSSQSMQGISCQDKSVVASLMRTNDLRCQCNPSVIGKAGVAGITLVALVVTIVVLLILVGITITYVFGDNGIFKLAQKAKDETENAIENEKGYMNDIGNTIDKYTNGINTPAVDTPIEKIKSDWVTLSKIAERISKDNSVNANSTEATAVVDGKRYTIKVGDIFEVEYDGVVKPVRVLGFKHDTLVTNYDGTANTIADTDAKSPKAGITFDFVDFMTGTTYMKMNTSNTNSGGWASTQMRKDLNGYTSTADAQTGAIGGLGAKLSNKEQIKQVKKDYITTYNTGAQSKSQDYLWMLSCAEIVNTGYTDGTSGRAKTREGSQYPYYKDVTTNKETGTDIPYNSANPALVKKGSPSDSANWWWLRSPPYDNSSTFCGVHSAGDVSNGNGEGYTFGVAPGFAI